MSKTMTKMDVTEMVDNQAVDTTVEETATCGIGATLIKTAVTMVVGYIAGKVVEGVAKGAKNLFAKHKKAKAAEAQPEEAIEVEVVD